MYTVHVFRERLSVFVCPFPFGFESGMWDLIVLIPNHSFLFTMRLINDKNIYQANRSVTRNQINITQT